MSIPTAKDPLTVIHLIPSSYVGAGETARSHHISFAPATFASRLRRYRAEPHSFPFCVRNIAKGGTTAGAGRSDRCGLLATPQGVSKGARRARVQLSYGGLRVE